MIVSAAVFLSGGWTVAAWLAYIRAKRKAVASGAEQDIEDRSFARFCLILGVGLAILVIVASAGWQYVVYAGTPGNPYGLDGHAARVISRILEFGLVMLLGLIAICVSGLGLWSLLRPDIDFPTAGDSRGCWRMIKSGILIAIVAIAIGIYFGIKG